MYFKYEQGWTYTDPKKISTAKENNLNYIAIYKECILKLKDGKEEIEWL